MYSRLFVAIATTIILLSSHIPVIASETFAMGCEESDVELHWHENTLFVGDDLDAFRKKVAPYLLANQCAPEARTSTAWCGQNDKWTLNNNSYLIKTWCTSGAYNFNTLWFFQVGESIEPLKVSMPKFEWTYHDSKEQMIKSVRQTGFYPPSNVLTNASFDPTTRELHAGPFCCMGDLETNITWVLRERKFKIYRYEQDAVQNGENEPQISIFYE
tara:strand:+ start:150 stop:794 length:645 start_codon:yes stop_codon:yes gene_type:complete